MVCCWSQCVPGVTQEGWGGIGKSVFCKVYQQHYTVVLIYTLTDCFSKCASGKDRMTDVVCVRNIVALLYLRCYSLLLLDLVLINTVL